MKKIVACDFDGTLTTRDTFVAFIRDVFGDRKFLWGFLRHTLLLVKMFLGLCPGGEVKERIFAYFFKGMSWTSLTAIVSSLPQVIAACCAPWVLPPSHRHSKRVPRW